MLKDQRSSCALSHCYPISQLATAVAEAMTEPPVRRPNSHIHGPHTVVVPSHDGTSYEFEGRPEGALALILRFTPGIRCWKPQPFTLRFYDGDRVRTYTPDLLIFTDDEPTVLAEVKPAAHFARPEVERLVRSMKRACRDAGLEYEKYTAEQLQQQPRLNNLLMLLPHSQDKNGSLTSLLRILRHAGRPMSLAQLQTLDPLIDAGAIAVGLRRGVIGSLHRFRFGPSFNIFAIPTVPISKFNRCDYRRFKR